MIVHARVGTAYECFYQLTVKFNFLRNLRGRKDDLKISDEVFDIAQCYLRLGHILYFIIQGSNYALGVTLEQKEFKNTL